MELAKASANILARIWYGLPLPVSQGRGLAGTKSVLRSLEQRGAIDDKGEVTLEGVRLLQRYCTRRTVHCVAGDPVIYSQDSNQEVL